MSISSISPSGSGVDSDSQDARQLAIGDLVRAESQTLVDEWRDLCRWDPILPPGTQPPIAPAVLDAIADALDRPQALDSAPDPAIEDVMEVFAVSVSAVEVAVELLVCLREVLRRRFVGRIPSDELAETQMRLLTVVDRAIGVAARHSVSRLSKEAYVDQATGLLNRRALDWDLEREIGRAARYGRAFTLALLAPERTLSIPEEMDRELSMISAALRDALRTGDAAYRAGTDQLVVLLPETDREMADVVLERVERSGSPVFRSGVASFPIDGPDEDELLAAAESRLSRRQGKGTVLTLP